MPRKQPPLQFEKSLAEFESLVEKMEEGELSLEDSLKHYERGITLSRVCQKALDEAEQRIEKLNVANGELEAFSDDADDD